MQDYSASAADFPRRQETLGPRGDGAASASMHSRSGAFTGRASRMNGLATLAIVLLASVGGTGCSKVKEKLAQKATEKAIEAASGGAKVELGPNGAVSVKDPTGKASISTFAKVPEDWPSSKLPPYPGATVATSTSSPDAKMLILLSKDAPEKVLEFYKNKTKGMSKLAETSDPTSTQFSMNDGPLDVHVAVSSKEAGSTEILLGISQKKNR